MSKSIHILFATLYLGAETWEPFVFFCQLTIQIMLKLQNFYSKDQLKNPKPKLSPIPPHPISLNYLLSRSYLHCESLPIFISLYFLVLVSIKNLLFSSIFQTTQIPYLFTCSVIIINKNTLLHSTVLFFMFENLMNYTVSCNSLVWISSVSSQRMKFRLVIPFHIGTSQTLSDKLENAYWYYVLRTIFNLLK